MEIRKLVSLAVVRVEILSSPKFNSGCLVSY